MKVKKLVKGLIIVSIISGVFLLTACQRFEISYKDSFIKERKILNKQSTTKEVENKVLSTNTLNDELYNNPISIDYKDNVLLVKTFTERIQLDSDGLKVNSNGDYVSISRKGLTVEDTNNSIVDINNDGISVLDGDNKVDISRDGIYVSEGNSKVEISYDGINVYDGYRNDSVRINFPVVDFIEDILGDAYSFDSFLTDDTYNNEFNILKNNHMNKLYLIDHSGSINGKRYSLRIYIENGYLVTMNCNEDSITVNGLYLVNEITDEYGNYYRYYSDIPAVKNTAFIKNKMECIK